MNVLFILFIIVIIVNSKSNLNSKLIESDPPYYEHHSDLNDSIKRSHQNGNVLLNIKVCEENLLLFNKIMNENDIFYWLSEGTVLGVIIENRILPWDDDTDVSFFYNERDAFINKALPSLKLNGFVVGVVTHDGNFICLLRKNEKIDIDIVKKDGKCMATKTSHANTSDCNKLIPYLKNIIPITFLNTTFNVPGEEYLEYLYRKEWKSPKISK